MDFMSDTLLHGHRFRTFNVLDDFNREILDIDAYSGPSLPLIPLEACHPFHSKAATDSGESCHPETGV